MCSPIGKTTPWFESSGESKLDHFLEPSELVTQAPAPAPAFPMVPAGSPEDRPRSKWARLKIGGALSLELLDAPVLLWAQNGKIEVQV